MKGAHAFPYPKLREFLADHPGWYYLRHACEARHSSEMLKQKRWRSMRAIWDGTILWIGHEEEYAWFMGPDIPALHWEDQRDYYRGLRLAQTPDYQSPTDAFSASSAQWT